MYHPLFTVRRPGVLCPGGLCLGVPVQEGLCPGCLCPGRLCPGHLCPGVSLSRRSLSRSSLSRGALCLGGLSLSGGLCRWGFLPGEGGLCCQGDRLPPVNRMTHACENITLPQTSFNLWIQRKNITHLQECQ